MKQLPYSLTKLSVALGTLWYFTMTPSFANGAFDDSVDVSKTLGTNTVEIETTTVQQGGVEIDTTGEASKDKQTVERHLPRNAKFYYLRACPSVDVLGYTLGKLDMEFLGKAPLVYANCKQGLISVSPWVNSTGWAFHDNPRDRVRVMDCDIVLKHTSKALYTALHLRYDSCGIGFVPQLQVTQRYTDPELNIITQRRLVWRESRPRLLLDVGLVYTGDDEDNINFEGE